jgi:hypothetical protein
MNDETTAVRSARQNELAARLQTHEGLLKEAKEKQQREFRRSLELRTSFYEKLAALDAGSIAVAASVGVAIIVKPEFRSGSLHANASWLAGIAIFLWVSLVSAVYHNFLALRVTKLELEASKAEANVAECLSVLRVRSSFDYDEKEKIIQGGLMEVLERQVHRAAQIPFSAETSYYRATALGYVSMVSFMSAYTLVVICILGVWWRTR